MNLNFTGEVMCQVARKKLENCKFNCKNSSFCKETFLNMAKDTFRVRKNSPDLESGGARVGFACFSHLDTSVRL